MNNTQIQQAFEKHEDEYLKFDRIKNKKSNSPDLHAFITLTELYPEHKQDIIAAAEHDQIYLFPDLNNDTDTPLTEQTIIELIRCGVNYDTANDSLSMNI